MLDILKIPHDFRFGNNHKFGAQISTAYIWLHILLSMLIILGIYT